MNVSIQVLSLYVYDFPSSSLVLNNLDVNILLFFLQFEHVGVGIDSFVALKFLSGTAIA